MCAIHRTQTRKAFHVTDSECDARLTFEAACDMAPPAALSGVPVNALFQNIPLPADLQVQSSNCNICSYIALAHDWLLRGACCDAVPRQQLQCNLCCLQAWLLEWGATCWHHMCSGAHKLTLEWIVQGSHGLSHQAARHAQPARLQQSGPAAQRTGISHVTAKRSRTVTPCRDAQLPQSACSKSRECAMPCRPMSAQPLASRSPTKLRKLRPHSATAPRLRPTSAAKLRASLPSLPPAPVTAQPLPRARDAGHVAGIGHMLGPTQPDSTGSAEARNISFFVRTVPPLANNAGSSRPQSAHGPCKPVDHTLQQTELVVRVTDALTSQPLPGACVTLVEMRAFLQGSNAHCGSREKQASRTDQRGRMSCSLLAGYKCALTRGAARLHLERWSAGANAVDGP